MQIVIRSEEINLFNSSNPLSMVHLSDMHIAFFSSRLLKIRNMIDEINPEIIVMTGDYFDTPIGANYIRDFIFSLSLKYTVVYISGNHDHYYGKRIFNRISNVHGANFIDFKSFVFDNGEKKLNIVSKFSINKTVREWPTILLIHDPNELNYLNTKGIDIALAGHLHGGQFIFYKDKFGFHYPGHFFYPYCIDKLKIEDFTLFVSRGLGDTLPFRFNCPKELIHFLIY
jgi:predicted MPP superfamily phosphohydrolase